MYWSSWRRYERTRFRSKKKYVRPDGNDFLIEGDQNVPDEKGESSDWGYWLIKERTRRKWGQT
jgi:hypothetical protein